ncbi:hypothetical protein ACSRUE_35680 [Sorangium sp. KYC3313]|uniref:hypothetical protein n=2 Tax=unclassified Sorangium TaxID=2621164 RepID=UPI003F897DBE
MVNTMLIHEHVAKANCHLCAASTSRRSAGTANTGNLITAGVAAFNVFTARFNTSSSRRSS